MNAEDSKLAGEANDTDEDGRIPRISPSSLYGLLKPSYCELREWLRSHDYEEEPAGAYRDLLMRMGIEHEVRHLERFPNAVDVALLPREEQEAATIELLDEHERVIYQGVMRATTTLAGREVEITGHTDFILPARDGWAIRDSKLNRSRNEYVELQLHVYGWLYEQTTGAEPVALQMHSGSGEILDVPYEQQTVERALELFGRMIELADADQRPEVHVSTSRCKDCGFRQHCWPQAIERGEIGLLPSMDRGTVEVLHERGVGTVEALLEKFDVDSLAEVERPWGGRGRPVGKGYAERILAGAEARVTGEAVLLAEPDLPAAENWVMFDLEGMPPRLDEIEKIYIWGLQVFGKDPGPFRPAVAGFGGAGDRDGWFAFLAECESIFAEYGDIPLVHWATYERTKIDMYITRYGDPNGTAARIKENLLDLLPITRASVAVPVPSYGLKDIETLTGYERQLEDYGGDWSMAKYIEATESEDQAERDALLGEILDYNREDLEATWAVLEWLRASAQSSESNV